MRKPRKILFIGPKPPPVSGLANISVILADRFKDMGHDVLHISSVPSFLARKYPGIAWRVARFFYFLFYVLPVFLLTLYRFDSVYLKVNGGIALAFDSVLVTIGRFFKKRLFLHHHSFSYLNDFSQFAKLAFNSAGNQAIHIANCQCMKERLEKMYGLPEQVRCVSNITILEDSDVHGHALSDGAYSKKPTLNKRKLVVGYMGYYTYQKGIDLFCETIIAARERGMLIEAIAVGIVHDVEFYDRVYSQYKDEISFNGPIFGSEKDKFFQQIDVLMFPSRYRTEAEPLTVYDALSKGTPVLSTDVGCLSEILSGYTFCRSVTADDYKESALDFLDVLTREEKSVRLATFSQYLDRRSSLQAEFDEFIDLVSN